MKIGTRVKINQKFEEHVIEHGNPVHEDIQMFNQQGTVSSLPFNGCSYYGVQFDNPLLHQGYAEILFEREELTEITNVS